MVEKSILLTCFCSFDLICPLLEKDNFIEICILHCLIALNSILFKPLFVSIHFRTPAVLLVFLLLGFKTKIIRIFNKN